jgi:ketosteroid isomerase-like protein
MTEIWADLDETFTEYSLVPEDFAEVGEYVIVTIRVSARMKASDARIDSTIYHVWHIRDGKIREAWTFTTKSEALEASKEPTWFRGRLSGQSGLDSDLGGRE